jgi:hypothetical protein
MRQLFAVPWLSSGGRIVLSVVCVALLVGGAFGLLKIRSSWKQGSPQELATGSIQRSLTRQSDPLGALLVAPATPASFRKSGEAMRLNSVPIPRPRRNGYSRATGFWPGLRSHPVSRPIRARARARVMGSYSGGRRKFFPAPALSCCYPRTPRLRPRASRAAP